MWATFAVYVVIGLYARRQVGEARRLREEQARPWVVVDFEPGWACWLVIENIGRTVATDVRVRFDPELESLFDKPWPWEESSLLRDGIPTLPPGRRLRMLFDHFPPRLMDQTLPKVYEVEARYFGPTQEAKPYVTKNKLDLNLYVGMSPGEKGMPELVGEVEKVHKEMKKWTDGTRGLHVKTTDRRKQLRRQERPFRLRDAKQIKESDGWRALGRHTFRLALQRRGIRLPH